MHTAAQGEVPPGAVRQVQSSPITTVAMLVILDDQDVADYSDMLSDNPTSVSSSNLKHPTQCVYVED